MPVPAWLAEVLERELRPWVRLSAEQVGQLHEHYQLLERWSQRINLTSVEPGPAMVVRHYCESLFLGIHLPVGHGHRGVRIADIGSGAGFPGVPIAVLWPEWQVVLVESAQRKSVFLREASRHLKNVTVVAQRAEEVPEEFDWVVSRAVHPREVLALVPRLAPRVALLLGESNARLLESQPGIAWAEAIRLPWGERRLCAFGEVRFHVEQKA